MDTFLQEIAKLTPALLAGLVPALIAYASLINRQGKARIDAQEIVNAHYLKQANEITALYKLLDDEKQFRTAAKIEYDSERENLNQRITATGEHLKRLENALMASETLSQEVTRERDTAKGELENTRKELGNTRKQLEAQIAEVQTTLDKISKDYDAMAKLYTDLQAERQRAEQAFQERCSLLETDITGVRGQLARVEAELVKTIGDRDRLQHQNAELESQQSSLNHRVSELESERDTLIAQVAGLRIEIDELRRAHSTDSAEKSEPTANAELPLSED